METRSNVRFSGVSAGQGGNDFGFESPRLHTCFSQVSDPVHLRYAPGAW